MSARPTATLEASPERLLAVLVLALIGFANVCGFAVWLTVCLLRAAL